jgi:hypothetical protein
MLKSSRAISGVSAELKTDVSEISSVSVMSIPKMETEEHPVALDFF